MGPTSILYKKCFVVCQFLSQFQFLISMVCPLWGCSWIVNEKAAYECFYQLLTMREWCHVHQKEFRSCDFYQTLNKLFHTLFLPIKLTTFENRFSFEHSSLTSMRGGATKLNLTIFGILLTKQIDWPERTRFVSERQIWAWYLKPEFEGEMTSQRWPVSRSTAANPWTLSMSRTWLQNLKKLWVRLLNVGSPG